MFAGVMLALVGILNIVRVGPLGRDRQRRRQRHRADVLHPGSSAAVGDAVRGRRPRHLRPRGVDLPRAGRVTVSDPRRAARSARAPSRRPARCGVRRGSAARPPALHRRHRRRVLRRRELGTAAAGVGQRRASRRPREQLGSGRPQPHGPQRPGPPASSKDENRPLEGLRRVYVFLLLGFSARVRRHHCIALACSPSSAPCSPPRPPPPSSVRPPTTRSTTACRTS